MTWRDLGWYGLGVASTVLGTVLVSGVVLPGPAPESPGEPAPRPAPTGPALVPARLDKTSLIIEQNDHCWTGVPGQTCGPQRTFM